MWTCDSCTPAQNNPTAASIILPTTKLFGASLNNVVYGTRLNGMSQNNFYGDDRQADTNFPLVRLTCAEMPGNTCTPDYVYYAFTHDDGPAGPNVHSIAPTNFGYTHFDLPSIPVGTYDFQTVTTASLPTRFASTCIESRQESSTNVASFSLPGR
jgi:hypothetical protein